MNHTIDIVVEGYPDEVACRKLCEFMGIRINRVFNKRGKNRLDKSLGGYNEDSLYRQRYWLALRDLDRDAGCAFQLIEQLVPEKSPYFLLRIPVRAIETWFMSDSERLCAFLAISQSKISLVPERIEYPKLEMVNLARKSRRRNIREDMVPIQGSKHDEGPAYASRLAEFAENHWRPEIAERTSDSLARCIRRLRAINH